MSKDDNISIGILMPDGSIQGANEKPKCHRCKKELEWKHLDNLGFLNMELYGVLCWDCLAQAHKNTMENGY